MNTHDKIELPEPAFVAGTKIGTTVGFFCKDSRIKKGDGAYTREQVISAIEADRKLHDRMLAHEWIRPSLGLDEDAPYRFDFYAQEIEKLKASLKKFGRNDNDRGNDNDNRKRRGEPVAWAAFDDNGNIRIWTAKKGEAKRLSEQVGQTLRPLYAAPQPLSESDIPAEPSRSEPGVSTTQALITLGKVIAGYRPGEEGWSEYDQQAYDVAMSIPQPLSESDIPAEPVVAEFPVKGKLHGPLGWIANNTNPEPVEDSVDIDDFIAAFIARGDITKDAFLEARQWVRDTYYNPAESVNMDLVRKWQAENGVKQDPNSREARMVVIRHDDDGKPTVWCDPEIADLVRALNDGGLATVGSCSGHGWRPGNIMLSDGRVLIICKDVDEAKGVVSYFPDINGEAPLAAEAVGGLSAEQLAEILSAYIKPEIIGEALEKLENAPWELSEPVKVDAKVSVPNDDALEDALSNLEHDNYEQSYSGYKNRQADIALIRTALARYK